MSKNQDDDNPDARKLKADFVLQMKMEKELKDAEKREAQDFIRRLQWERREAALDGVVLKAQEVALIQQKQLEQEERLAAEMDMVHREEFKAVKERQWIRENTHELKLLEIQLRAAYVNKCLKAQIAEKEALKMEENLRDKQARDILVKSYGNEEERLCKLETQEIQQRQSNKISLLEQMREKEKQKEEKFQEYLMDQRIVDEIVKTLQEEKLKECQEKQVQQQKLKEEMEYFQRERELTRKNLKQAALEENKMLLEHQMKTQEANLSKEQEREAKMARAEAMGQKMADEMMAKRKAEDERKDLLAALILAEKDNKTLEDEKQAIRDEISRRQNGREEYMRVVEEKNRLRKEEIENDRRFMEQNMQRNQQELNKEREKELQKRNQRISDKIYNQRAMLAKKEKHAEEMKLAQLTLEIEARAEKERLDKIQTERIRMLKDHAPNLVGYFPPGTLQQTDLDVLGIACNSPALPVPEPPCVCPDDTQHL